MPAWKPRAVLLKIINGLEEKNNKPESFDRLIPNQDILSGKGFGNLIALPLQGQLVKKNRTVFLNPQDHFKPYEDQWGFLKSIKKIGEEQFDELIELLKLKHEEKEMTPSHSIGSREELELVIENCDFIKQCIDFASTLTEPLWYCMISNLAVFDGGAEKIHEFSNSYPTYTWAETEAKIEHALRDTKPHTCEYIREEGFRCSKNCEVRSPAGLGYKINNQTKEG